MTDTIAGLALVYEIGALIALVATHDGSDYVQSKRNSEDSWYTRINSAFDIGAAQGLIASAEYTKTAAIADVDTLTTNTLIQFGAANYPALFEPLCTGTAYNETALVSLADNAEAKALEAVAIVKLQTIETYAKISQSAIAAFVNLLNIGKNTKSVVTVSSNPYGANITPMANQVFADGAQYTNDITALKSIQESNKAANTDRLMTGGYVPMNTSGTGKGYIPL